MRKLIVPLLSFLLISLYSCSGSDTYRGLWKATNPNGEKFIIKFEAKSFSIRDSTGNATKFDYTQNSVSIENSVETYGIKVSDGRTYQVHFPIADDESKGIIADENGNPLFTIGKNGYVKYEDIYKLK